MLVVTNEIQIPLNEFEFTVARSSGPGGQNVNKVNSKVVLRWNAVQSPSLPLGVRVRFLERYGARLTSGGELLIASDTYRDQPRNHEACLAKLAELLRQVASPPKPRRETKPSRSSRERRKQGKRHRGEIKKQRGRVRGD